ncbi:MAG: PIN domain-containing protein [Xanthomonadales bacterium]|nr:PIN domain-containing protein [Xanthomonadales bacterium]
MIALDTNVLVYAHRHDSPFHEAARQAVATLAEGRASWAIAWPCLHEFFSITTHPRIYAPPSTPAQAVLQIDAWLSSPSLVLLAENDEHWPQLRGLIEKSRLQGPMVHDARIAALCLSHGVRELWSADRDFSRYAGLRTRNPLV